MKSTIKKWGVRVLGDPREKLLKKMPRNAVCAEIGVWKGDFTQQILDIAAPRELHLIDPWAYQTDFGDRLFGGLVAQSQQDMDAIFQGVQQRFGHRSEVHYHREFSDKAALLFADLHFDWIYIDGNHYYEFVLADLRNFFSKVKLGGYLAGDDLKWTSPELHGDLPVLRAVRDFINEQASAKLVSTYGGQFIIQKDR
ncbi:MAG: class I SAM-dependent methyltransferase [Flavobacteriales bacterium]|nr:class I SAM-dependent methyltransferase [Flavobacteriales bacterium]